MFVKGYCLNLTTSLCLIYLTYLNKLIKQLERIFVLCLIYLAGLIKITYQTVGEIVETENLDPKITTF